MTKDRQTNSQCGQAFLVVLKHFLMVLLIFFVFYLSWTISVHGNVSKSGDIHESFPGNRNSNALDRTNGEEQNTKHVQSYFGQISDSRKEAMKTVFYPAKKEKKSKKYRRKRIRNKNRKKGSASKSNYLSKTDISRFSSNLAKSSLSFPKRFGKGATSRRGNKKRKQISSKGRQVVRVENPETSTFRNVAVLSTQRLRPDNGKKNRPQREKNRNGENDKEKDKEKWSTWGSCSVTCGVGQQERVRSCGIHCQEIESKPCLSHPCQGKEEGEWMDKWAYIEMFDPNTQEDSGNGINDACERWMKCSNKSIQHYITKIADLPSCPCFYPISVESNRKIFDEDSQKDFLWEDATDAIERNEVYKPGAKYCIRSLLPEQSFTLAAQHCCYDEQLRLITRGRDAGTPNLVSPQISRELHKKVDVLPWVTCKGDWTRYNMIISPNNHRQCLENPCLEELKKQVRLAKSF